MSNRDKLLVTITAALEENNVQRAFDLCRKSIADDPNNAEAHRHLGLLHAAAGKRGDAIKSGKRACELFPDDPESWSALGRIYAMLGDMEDAVQCFAEAVTLDVKFADGWHNLGTACKQLGKDDLAFTALKNALLIDDTRASSYLNLGTLMIQASQYEDAVECFERAVKLDPTLVSARSHLANQMSQKGKVEQAESLFRQSLGMDPDHVEGWMGLGRTLEDMGEADGALAAYVNALKRRPDHSLALGQYLALLPKEEKAKANGVDWLEQAENIIEDEGVKPEARALVGYGLLKFYSKRSDYKAAATAGLLANGARRDVAGPLNRDALRARVDHIIRTYSADFFSKHRRLGLGTDQPVFIVGLPRSGTTLTEQILSAHPQLHGSGELSDLGRLAASVLADQGGDGDEMWQAASLLAQPLVSDVSDVEMQSRVVARKYLTALRNGVMKGRLRISDKSPLNFFQLAFAALMFPNAKIIHCHRTIRDNALSIWMENFNPDQQWSTDFGDLAFFHHQYQRLMVHWHEVLPLNILDMKYEDTVADLEGQARKLVDFLGAPWDSACLDFHKSTRAVQTPSRWQVRQPIYTRSVERWKAYAEYLPDLDLAFGGNEK